ncbi:MAG: methyltransferase domain-containing protein [Acidobacteriota bacterium]|jgi:cyclopropane fatty-acyl-phospholipid synthase-like methyltransferase|nr:MAG: SAM-dependent methyltransferase [Acidobacteriota bacterium]
MTRIASVLLVALLIAAPVAAQTVIESNTPLRDRDVIFVPTREAVATAMMKLAGVTADDVVYDLGCGDGALLIAAARLGARAVGIDIDPQRIKEATEKVREAGVADRVTLIRGDIFDPSIEIREATVVTLYLLQSLNQKLMPRLKAELRPGTRIVSHAFTMGDSWPPDRTEQVDSTRVHLWTIR